MSPPDKVGLCPDPDHMGEFYVPHGGNCPEGHEEPVPLIEYVPLQAVVDALRHVDCVLAICPDLLPERNPCWDAAGYIERKFAGR